MQNFFISGTVGMQANIFQNGHTTESNSIRISQSGTKIANRYGYICNINIVGLMINLQCNLGVVVCILFCTSTNHFNIRKRCSAFYILRGTCIFLFDNEE